MPNETDHKAAKSNAEVKYSEAKSMVTVKAEPVPEKTSENSNGAFSAMLSSMQGGDMDLSAMDGFNDIVSNITSSNMMAMSDPLEYSVDFLSNGQDLQSTDFNSIQQGFVSHLLGSDAKASAQINTNSVNARLPPPPAKACPLTSLNTDCKPFSVTRVDSISLTHVIGAEEKARIPTICWGQPRIIPGTRLYAVGSYDDRAEQNYLVVGDTKNVRVEEGNPNNQEENNPISSVLRLGKKCISELHPRIIDGHPFLFCAMGAGDLGIFHIGPEGKSITDRGSYRVSDGYNRQMAFSGDLMACGGEGTSVNIWNVRNLSEKPVSIHKIPLNGQQVSSVSFGDGNHIDAGCVRYIIENNGKGNAEYVVCDFNRSGYRPIWSVSEGIPIDTYCHLSLSEHLVALAGEDHTIRVRDIRNPNKVYDQTKIHGIGGIGGMERNSAGTAFMIHGNKNVITFRQMPGHNTAQIWSRLEEPSSKGNSYFASFANFDRDNQHTQDSIVYADSVGNVGVITENYRFQELPY